MKDTIETRSPRTDLLAAIVAALLLAVTLGLTSWPLRMKDVITALVWALVLGMEGTIAVLKYKGVIQVRQPSPEETARRQRRQGTIMIVTVVVLIAGLTWLLLMK